MPTSLPRRRILQALGALSLSASATLRAEMLAAAPRMTEGPFYPTSIPLDHDNDLTRVGNSASAARGEIFDLVGRVLDRSGKPLAGARVEIWQCDALGHYHHVGVPEATGDPNFQGFGVATTDAGGHYRFRTIRPVPYPGRTPHIHYKVRAGTAPEFTSQVFIEGEARNERDFLFRSLSKDERRRAVVELRPAMAAGASLAGRFEIVLPG
jgi:protocatechuate 3,4-dioxygenase, beta subunit